MNDTPISVGPSNTGVPIRAAGRPSEGAKGARSSRASTTSRSLVCASALNNTAALLSAYGPVSRFVPRMGLLANP